VANLAERLATGNLLARAELAGPREVRQVAVSLNRLAQRIGELLAHEREAAADLSHRLRTPLTALRIDAEALRDAADQARITADLEAIERAVDEIIRLARRPPVQTTAQVCDASQVVQDRARFWSALAEEEGRSFEVVVPSGPVIVRLDADSLSVCLDALLGNVFAHTPEGTAFYVGLTANSEVGGASLVIADDGPGIALPPQLRRGVSTGGSTGLGLDIARRAAAASGGGLTVGRTSHGGTRIAVELGATNAAQIDRELRRQRRPFAHGERGLNQRRSE
jgi:signal transduction histidine kinase